MPLPKPDEIRGMKEEEREKLLVELRAELMRLQMRRRAGTLDNPAQLKLIKRTIARILAIKREEGLRSAEGAERRA